MFISTRYLFKQLFISTLSVSLILSGAIWLTQSLRFIDIVINKGLPFTTFLRLTLYLFPDIFGVILPIAFFISVLFTYNKLENDHELIIYRAVGISDIKLATPVFMLGLLIMVFLYYVNISLMPKTLRHFKDMEYTIRNQASAILIQEGQFTNLEGVTIFVRSQKPGGRLEGILVHDSQKTSQSNTIIAEKGYLSNTPQGLQLIMLHGSRQHLNKNSGQPEFLIFDEYTVNLTQQKKDIKPRDLKPYEMGLNDLFNSFDPNSLETRKRKAEGHKRLITPVLAFIFGFIGVTILLFGEFSRRRRVKKILVAIGCVLILQLFVLASLNAADKLTWLIPIIYSVIGGTVCLFYSILKWHWMLPVWARMKS